MSVLRLWKNNCKGPPASPAVLLLRHTSAEALSDLCLQISMVTVAQRGCNPVSESCEDHLDNPGSH